MSKISEDANLPIPYVASDVSESYIIQKSTPLLSLWQSPLTLAEFKILDAYLSRINSHDSSRRRVRFEKGELENLLGVSRINLRDLEKRIQHLGIMIKIADRTDGFTSISLFEEAVCELDEHGLWQIDLQCTQQAMQYIFNIENLGYLRYRLRSIVQLKSRYSYLLFLYLEQNRFRSPWEVSVDELRQILSCTSEFYKSYREFNKNILKKCTQELHDKTSCRFRYVPIRKGRSVERIRFYVDPISDLLNTSTTIEAPATTMDTDFVSTKELLVSALFTPGCHASEFSDTQLSEIFSCLSCIPVSKLPTGPGCIDITMQWYHYLAQKFAELNRRAESKVINNRFGYLIAMIKADM